MDRSTQTSRAVMRTPTAFLPLAMSAVALALVLGYVLRYGGGPVQDEGPWRISGSCSWGCKRR